MILHRQRPIGCPYDYRLRCWEHAKYGVIVFGITHDLATIAPVTFSVDQNGGSSKMVIGLASRPGLVALRQAFVCRCQSRAVSNGAAMVRNAPTVTPLQMWPCATLLMIVGT